MKIIVAVKRVIDFQAVVRIKADGSAIETANMKMVINPFDEIAVEEAVRLKEKGLATEIIVVSIGQEAAQETLRTALAMGADRAILIKTENNLEPLAIAKLLQQITLQESPTLFLLGKQAVDSDDNQVGQMLAGLLNWSQATFASKLNFQDQKLSVTREIDGGLETLLLTLPAVVTADLRLNEPRYLSLPNIMQAKKKPLTIKPIEEFNLDLTPRQTLLQVTIPEKKRAQIKVNTVTELIQRLTQEAQVI